MYGKSFALGSAALFLFSNPIALGQAEDISKRGMIVQVENETLPATADLANWKRFGGQSFELWLPETYEGGDLENDVDVAIDNLKRLGPEFARLTQVVESSRDRYSLLAIDTEVGPSGALTSAIIASEPTFSTLTIDTYMDAVLNSLPPQFQVVERDIIPLQRYQAGRLIVEAVLNATVTAKQAIYAIKEGNTVWIVTYSTHIDEFEQRLPTFEKSMETFVIKSSAESVSLRQ